jgi:hypothetical protein
MKKHLFNVIFTALITMAILLVMSPAIPCLAAQADASYPICWGVFIGVPDYTTNPDIVYSDNDAQGLYAALSPVWGASHTKLLVDSAATRAAIFNAIGWMAANARPQDTVTFTFSGLGVAPGSICPSDFVAVTGGITTTQLAAAFAAVKAQKILIILDCNYSGKFRISLSKEGRVLMLSCGAGEKSVESPQYQHGVFTYFILEALNHFDTYDANHDYELSAEEIASYANGMTTDINGLQHPILEDQVSDQLPLIAKFVFTLNDSLPAGTTILTLDGVDYLSPLGAQFWVPGGTHTMTVPDIVYVDNNTRYIFTGWEYDSYLPTRIISKGSYTTSYRLEYLFIVTSPYGEVTGTGWHSSGSTAEFTVTPSIETPNTRRYFTSWSGDYTGTSHTASLYMDSPKTITANWRTEYLLILHSAYNTPSGAGWYTEGTTANISIEPDQGSLTRQIFDSWGGDITSTDSSTTVIMNSPKTITAHWHADNSSLNMLIVIIVVAAALLVGVVLVIILMRRKKTTPLPAEAASPSQPPPPPPAPLPPPSAVTPRPRVVVKRPLAKTARPRVAAKRPPKTATRSHSVVKRSPSATPRPAAKITRRRTTKRKKKS